MTARKRRGPKPRPAAQTRRNTLNVRLTDAEHAALAELAAADSRSMGDFLVVRALGRRFSTPPTGTPLLES